MLSLLFFLLWSLSSSLLSSSTSSPLLLLQLNTMLYVACVAAVTVSFHSCFWWWQFCCRSLFLTMFVGDCCCLFRGHQCVTLFHFQHVCPARFEAASLVTLLHSCASCSCFSCFSCLNFYPGIPVIFVFDGPDYCLFLCRIQLQVRHPHFLHYHLLAPPKTRSEDVQPSYGRQDPWHSIWNM